MAPVLNQYYVPCKNDSFFLAVSKISLGSRPNNSLYIIQPKILYELEDEAKFDSPLKHQTPVPNIPSLNSVCHIIISNIREP